METQPPTPDTAYIMGRTFTRPEFIADVENRLLNTPDTKVDHAPAFRLEVVADMINYLMASGIVDDQSDESDEWCEAHGDLVHAMDVLEQAEELIEQANEMASEALSVLEGLRERRYPGVAAAVYQGN